MPQELTTQQIVYLAILLVAFGLLLTERLRADIVAVLIVIALAWSGVLPAKDAVAGFASEPALVVAAIFILGAGMQHTGLSDTLGVWIGHLASGTYTRAVGVLVITVALLSAFTHHVTTTALMLPVTLSLARKHDIAPSKLLMPLSFAASLGTTITIIGAPAFLLASGILQQAGRPGLGIFSIAPVGLALTATGTIFMLLVGRMLLPDRGKTLDLSSELDVTDYFTELIVKPESPFLGKTLPEVEADDRLHFKTVGWLRDGRRVSTSSTQHTLESGDVLLVRTSPNEIATIRQESGVELRPVEQYLADNKPANGDEDGSSEAIMQTVVAPGSDVVGRTIAQVDFRKRFGVVVLSLWRQRGWLHEELSQIRLHPGDVLVLQGEPEALARVSTERDFLMMFPFQGEPRLRRRAPIAGAIMLATIIATALNVLPLEIATLAGAAAMVLVGCLTLRQAYRSIDVRIFVFIAGAIPLGAAMQKSGVADVLADWLQAAVGGWSETFILLALFGVVAVITQFMSDSATTAVLGPVALALAQGLGHSPEAYVVTVAMASVAAFLTPIGHHGNLLVYGPGRYRFSDFVLVGTPLTAIVAVVVVLIVQLVWPVS